MISDFGYVFLHFPQGPWEVEIQLHNKELASVCPSKGLIFPNWDFLQCILNLVRGDRSVSAALRAVPLSHPHQLRPAQAGRRLPAALQLRQAVCAPSDPAGMTMFLLVPILNLSRLCVLIL